MFFFRFLFEVVGAEAVVAARKRANSHARNQDRYAKTHIHDTRINARAHNTLTNTHEYTRSHIRRINTCSRTRLFRVSSLPYNNVS